MSKATLEGPPSLKQQEVMPLHKSLTQIYQEAFGWDSSLVRKMREEYFRNHCPNFNNENSCNFTDVFWGMTKTASLLGSAIYEIKEAWTGWDELKQANYALQTLPKGLKFFTAVSPSESPKVMGLEGIHNPDVLCCFSGLTHYPWCEKEGQNKGTIINHLQTVHYKLGLICKKCFGCLSVMLEAICHHGQKDCQPSGEGGPNESSLSAYLPAWCALGQSFLNGNLDRGSKENSSVPQAALSGIAPTPSVWPQRRTRQRRCHLPTWHIPLAQSSHIWIRLLLSSANPELSMMSTKDAGLYEH